MMNRYKSSNNVGSLKDLPNHDDAIWTHAQGVYCCGYQNTTVKTFHVERSLKNIDVVGVLKQEVLLSDTELVYPYDQYHMANPIDGCETHIDVPVFYLSYPWSHNHQHWLIEDIPRLWMYFKLLEHFPDLHILIDQNGKRKTTLELFDLLGIDCEKVISYQTGQIAHIKQIFVSSFLGVNFSYISPEAWELYTTIRDIANKKSSIIGMSHVYVSRRDTKNGWWHKRDLINEDEIIETATNHGFEELIPTKYSLTDEIALFARADRIIGAAGAGMSNLLWLNNDAKVLILNHPRLSSQFYDHIAVRRGCQCKVCENGTTVENANEINVPWMYPTHVLEKQIGWLLD